MSRIGHACGGARGRPAISWRDALDAPHCRGVGGFGIVYRAWDHALEREVALKEYMPAALAARGRGLRVSLRAAAHAETFAVGLRSFVNEARMLARFDHPSLVKVYRFWEDHGTAYMVMPCYRGRTLREVRQAMDEPPDEAACRAVIDPLLSALDLLHHQDVYHRDIAPDNILVGDDGTPVLLDFGAARRAVSDRTQSLTAILKPNFAPLEQYADVSAMRQGPWTDLYGLGATVYYFLTGQAPMPAAARALQDELVPLSSIEPPGCSHDFLAAFDWALALRPPDRPQSVVMLRDVLDGRMAVPSTVRRDTTRPGVTARSVGGWSAQSIAPTVTLPPSVDVPTEPAPLDDAVPVDRAEVRRPLPVRRVAGEPATVPAPALRVAASRRARVPLFATTAGATLLAAALWWAQLPRPTAAEPAGPLAATEADSPRSRPAVDVPRPRASPLPVSPVAAAPAPAGGQPRRATVQRSVATLPPGPRELCGDRTFVSLVVCMKRECVRPELAQHAECQRLATLETPQPQP